MTSRQIVYSAIDKERDYQDLRWNEKTTDSKGIHSVGEFLVFMQDYLTEAFHHMSRNPEPEATTKALDTMRKITAMGVSCMEQNGVIYRTKK